MTIALPLQLDTYKALEIVATLSGLTNVYLVAKRNIWNYLFGLIAVSAFLFIFIHVKLYADVSLHIIYIILQFYGLYQWLYGGANHTALEVKIASATELSYACLAIVAIAIPLSLFLKAYTHSTLILLDASTTAISLVAQWMMSKKWLQHWYFWIAVNICSIGMYAIKGLYLTTALYTLYLGICAMGYREWRAAVSDS